MKRIVGTFIVLLTAAICIRLGMWQLSRLSQRKSINAIVVARGDLPPVDLPGGGGEAFLPYRKASAVGSFDFTRQIVKIGRPSNGVPGVVVITPLLLDANEAVLVERGWVPSPDARTIDLAGLDEPAGITTVHGVLVEGAPWAAPTSGNWPVYLPAVHPDSLEILYPYHLGPLLLRRTEAPPKLADRVFRAVDSGPLGNGPHLSYAVQWFSFAAIALVGGWVLLYHTPRAAVGVGIDSQRADPQSPRPPDPSPRG